MAALGSENVMSRAVPVEAAFAKSSASGNDGLIAVALCGDVIQWHEIVRRQSGDPPARGFKVVDQGCVLKTEFVRKALGFDCPGKVGSFDPAICYRASDAETGLLRANARGLHKLTDNLIEAGITPAGKDGC